MRSNDTAEEPVQQLEDGQEVLFHEGDEYYFQCRAGGGTYSPDFLMTLGDEDVTDLFDTETNYQLEEGQPGLRRYV